MSVRVDDLSKRFGTVNAVDHISFNVSKGEILTLLGPSGCGKTTTLRCIAGLDVPDAGDIYIDEKIVSSKKRRIMVPPHMRGLSMVFQSYALWPHMTVFKNITYGLRIQKLSKEETQRRTASVAELLEIDSLLKRYPAQLSGGQQQRVALARSFVLEPKLMLLDEPLSNLDAKLRKQMRFELKSLQRKLNITFIYVTHDQAEAMALSDRIILMREGVIKETSKPEELYLKPKSGFAASFTGTEKNIFKGRLHERIGNRIVVKTAEGIDIQVTKPEKGEVEDEIILTIRPEVINIDRNKPDKDNVWKAEIIDNVFLGGAIEYLVNWKGKEIEARTAPSKVYRNGEIVYIQVDPENIHIIVNSGKANI